MSSLVDSVEVAYPQQPHVATILLLDTSGSMAGQKIAALREGIRVFLEETQKDDLAAKRVDLAIVTFGGTAQITHQFSPVTAYEPIHLEAAGATPMGQALELGMRLLEERKVQYRQEGTDYYRPWLFLITDGDPTDMRMGDDTWKRVVGRLHDSTQAGKFAFFCIGVDDADMKTLTALCGSGRQPLKLRGLAFKELFEWLSRSQRQVSASQTGDKVQLPAVDWGDV